MQLTVGIIGKPHGIHGAAFVEPRTDDPLSRFVVGAVFQSDAAGLPQVTVRRVHQHKDRWVLEFEEIPNRDALEEFKGAVLTILVDDETPAENDEWYDFQLVGLQAVDTQKNEQGTVVRVDHLPAQDVLAIRTSKGEVLVPFVKEIVPVVNIAEGYVQIDAPGGLFDLDEN